MHIMPWSLLLTALVLIVASAAFVTFERRRSRGAYARADVVETTLVRAAHLVQRQHREKFGRASTDLEYVESSLPTATSNDRHR